MFRTIRFCHGCSSSTPRTRTSKYRSVPKEWRGMVMLLQFSIKCVASGFRKSAIKSAPRAADREVLPRRARQELQEHRLLLRNRLVNFRFRGELRAAWQLLSRG